MFTSVLRAALLALCVSVAGCGSHVEIVELHKDRAADTLPYQKLLAIGIASDADQRRDLENVLVDTLRSQGVAAVAGYTLTGPSAVLLQDEIDAAAAASESDGILIAHLASTRAAAEVVPGRVGDKSVCRGGNPVDMFLYEHKELREPDSVAVAYEVIIVTNLYDARTQSRIWTVQSTCFETANFEEVLVSEARAIARQLRRDELVRVSRKH
jgi:hypothetical protein